MMTCLLRLYHGVLESWLYINRVKGDKRLVECDFAGSLMLQVVRSVLHLTYSDVSQLGISIGSLPGNTEGSQK